jgi:FemAB-related protein (PEP-CTERM system-associated)
MIVKEVVDSDVSAWDAYVRNAPRGLPYHLTGWRRVLADTYGYESHYLMAVEQERIVGVLPLLFVRSSLVGNRAITTQGGLCADSDEAGLALIEAGRECAKGAGVKQFVIQDTRQAWPGDLHTTNHHVHCVVDVGRQTDALWQGLDKNVRRQVRMARKNGLTVHIDRTGESASQLYSVLSRYAHGAGTPLFGRVFLDNVIRAFPDGFEIAVVYSGKEPVGAYFQLVMGDTVYGAWGATLHEYLAARATYLAYWEILADAAEGGYRYLDMGRSPAGSSVSAFKGQWGGVWRPIYQQMAHIGTQHHTASITERVSSDYKFRLLTRVWPHLPLPVAQFFGPKLRRHVPFA